MIHTFSTRSMAIANALQRTAYPNLKAVVISEETENGRTHYEVSDVDRRPVKDEDDVYDTIHQKDAVAHLRRILTQDGRVFLRGTWEGYYEVFG